MQAAPQQRIYDPALDGLRAVSVLLVLAFHSGVPGLQNGRIGVSVFFVLSGYLITRMLLDGISIGEFYERRARRLIPGYLAFLLVALVAAPPVFPTWNVLPSFLWSFFYLSDYAVPYFGMRGPLTHTWSLAIEMQFYLLWPFLIRRGFDRWLILAFAGALAIRFGSYWAIDHWRATYMTLHGNSAGLILGSLLAVYKSQIRPKPWLAWAGAIIVFGSAISDNSEPSMLSLFAITTAEIGAVAIIAGGGKLHEFLATGPLVWLGKRSYGFYLWHLPIVMALQPHVGWVMTFAIAGMGSTAIAAFSYSFVEKPFRRSSRPAPSLSQEPAFAKLLP